MAMVLADEGGLDILGVYCGSVTRPTSFTLRLFTDSNAAADTDTQAAGHTVAAGGGYVDKTINLSGGAAPAATIASVGGIPAVAWPAVTWTFTGALTGSATIKGYQIIAQPGNKLIVSENTTNFQPQNNNDTYTVTPTIKLGYGTPS